MRDLLRFVYNHTLRPLRSWLIILWRLAIFRVLKGQKTDRYGIKIGYVIRPNNHHFDDTPNRDEYQDTIYKRIHEFAADKQMTSIMDIGCGSAFKLLKYFDKFETVGLELPPALDYLKKNHPERKWIYSDFSFVPEKQFDMAIAVDVIEHLSDPDPLLNYLRKIKTKFVALSTPDRSTLPYRGRLGPPINKCHVREWAQNEFVDYVGRYLDLVEVKRIQDHYNFVIGKPKP